MYYNNNGLGTSSVENNGYNPSQSYGPVPNNYYQGPIAQTSLKSEAFSLITLLTLKNVAYAAGIIFITLLIACMVATMHSCGVNIRETIMTGQWVVDPSKLKEAEDHQRAMNKARRNQAYTRLFFSLACLIICLIAVCIRCWLIIDR